MLNLLRAGVKEATKLPLILLLTLPMDLGWRLEKTSPISYLTIPDYLYESYHTNDGVYSSNQRKSVTVTRADKWAKMQSESTERSAMNALGNGDGSLDNI